MTTVKFDRNAARIVLEDRVWSLEQDLEMIDRRRPDGDLRTITSQMRIDDLNLILEIIDQDWSDNELMDSINDRIRYIKATENDNKWTQRQIADLSRLKVVLKGQDV